MPLAVGMEYIFSKQRLGLVEMILTQLLGIVDSDIAWGAPCDVAVVFGPIAVLVRDAHSQAEKGPRLTQASLESNRLDLCCLEFLSTSMIVPNPCLSIVISPLPKDNLNHLG
jgi:hypothetical protein